MPSAWADAWLEIWEGTRQQTPRGLARHGGEAGERVSAGSCGDMLGGAGLPGRKPQLCRWMCSISHTPGVACSSPSEGIL